MPCLTSPVPQLKRGETPAMNAYSGSFAGLLKLHEMGGKAMRG